MSYLPFWASGLALAAVMIFHWFSLHRMMAVSGRFTALVNRLRHGKEEAAPEMSPEELMAAIAAATSAEFGGEDETLENEGTAEVGEEASPSQPPSAKEVERLAPQSPAHHFLFFGFLVLGGVIATLIRGDGFQITSSLQGEIFQDLFSGPMAYVALLVGGLFVGFGTRMSGGCTSGHGLCGVSRFQPGSLVATASFFGAGIATSLLLGAL